MITTYNTESDRQHDQVHITPPGENRRGEGDQPGIRTDDWGSPGAQSSEQSGRRRYLHPPHTLRPHDMAWDR